MRRGGFALELLCIRGSISTYGLRVTVLHGWRIFYNAYAQFLQGAPTRLENWVRNDPSAMSMTMYAAIFR